MPLARSRPRYRSQRSLGYTEHPVVVGLTMQDPLPVNGVTPPINGLVGETGTLSYTLEYIKGRFPDQVPNVPVDIASLDSNIVRIDDVLGGHTYIGAGTTQITLTPRGLPTMAFALDVIVTNPVNPVASIQLTPTSSGGLVDATALVTLQALNSLGQVVPNQVFTESSNSDPTKAIVQSIVGNQVTLRMLAIGSTQIRFTTSGVLSPILTVQVVAPPSFTIRYASKATAPPYLHTDLEDHFPDPAIGKQGGATGPSVMFGDQSGAPNVTVLVRPYNGTGVAPAPVTGQVHDWPKRTPFTEADALAPDGYAFIMEWDLSGTNGTTAYPQDIDRAVQVHFTNPGPAPAGPGYDTVHVRTYYRYDSVADLGGITASGIRSVGKKFIRARINGPNFTKWGGAASEAAGYLFYLNRGTNANPDYWWNTTPDDLGPLNNNFSSHPDQTLRRPICDGQYHYIEWAWILDRAAGTLEMMVWHEDPGELIIHYGPLPMRSYNPQNSSQWVDVLPSHGCNVVFFDSVFNSPAATAKHRQHSRVIANSKIGLRVGAGW